MVDSQGLDVRQRRGVAGRHAEDLAKGPGHLQQLGLPRSEYVTALVAFNAGVEVGQLSVIAAAWLLVVSWAERKSWYRRRLLVPASLAIAAAGIFWTVQRLQA